MNLHKNARTICYSRAEIVRRVTEQRETSKAVATAFGICAEPWPNGWHGIAPRAQPA